MSAALNKTATKSGPWWLELMLVDFRHAFWPWVVYLAAIGYRIYHNEIQSWSVSSSLLIALAGPAIVVQIFCVDFTRGTAATLLTFPRSRSSIWLARVLLCLLLLAPPLLIMVGRTTWLFLTFGLPLWDQPNRIYFGIVLIFATQFAYAVWCYFTLGPLLAVVLQKPQQVWTAMVISPFALVIIWLGIFGLLKFDTGINLHERLPFIPESFFWFAIVAGPLALALSWRLWLRLEVRS